MVDQARRRSAAYLVAPSDVEARISVFFLVDLPQRMENGTEVGKACALAGIRGLSLSVSL